MIRRREFLELAARFGGGALLAGCHPPGARHAGQPDMDDPTLVVNDVHSQLNATRVRAIRQPTSDGMLASVVRDARANGEALSIAGGRHAMGGQQFGTGTVLIDMNGMRRVLEFDRARGEIEVEAGIQWPELYAYLGEHSAGAGGWSFRQKQTGADRLSIGGALAANVHGRGLTLPPFVSDVAAFTLVDARGNLVRCSRSENAELFRAAIGGYGLFGPMASVRLRLTPRHKVERLVEVIDLEQLPGMFERRIADGFRFGDFQFATDLDSDSLLHRGVFSCYRDVADDTPMPAERRELSVQNWHDLLYLAHMDRAAAFEVYSRHYLATSGQIYWSDEHQMSTYVDDYHRTLGARLGGFAHGGEMITEIYVPRNALVDYLGSVRTYFRSHRTELIYGTIRLIERDTETLLAWAKQPYACIIFNLHVTPTPDGLERSAREFRWLIDRALLHGGSYYLTYHRWAERRQVLAAYPQFPEFLAAKLRFDPAERFRSDWYSHHRRLLG